MRTIFKGSLFSFSKYFVNLERKIHKYLWGMTMTMMMVITIHGGSGYIWWGCRDKLWSV